VVFETAQRGVQVGHHLLRPDDPDRAGAAGVGGRLATAGRGRYERAGLGDRRHTAHDEVRAGEQPPDVVGAGGPVHGQGARHDGVVPPARVGRANALPHPVEGGAEIARYLVGLLGRAPAGLVLLERTVNGQPGLVAQQDGRTVAVYAFAVAGERIRHIWVVLNPEKLRPWPAAG
jgi:RNA polymerase sigma-70 factor (ECF subfamily)